MLSSGVQQKLTDLRGPCKQMKWGGKVMQGTPGRLGLIPRVMLPVTGSHLGCTATGTMSLFQLSHQTCAYSETQYQVNTYF